MSANITHTEGGKGSDSRLRLAHCFGWCDRLMQRLYPLGVFAEPF